jgi:hypothetical protein
MTASAAPAAKPRRTAIDRAARRVRILARLQEGWSYDRIALAEDLTRERIRQIVVKTMERRAVDPSRAHAILQSARLDGALRLAAEKVAEGDLRAVDPLLRVLDRLDRYQGAAAALGTEDSDAYAARYFPKCRAEPAADAACSEADQTEAPFDDDQDAEDDEAEGDWDFQIFSPAER